MREGDLVFGSDLVPHDDLVDVVELIPVFVLILWVSEQWLKLGTSRNGHVQGFGGEETLLVKQVKVVFVNEVTQKLVRESMQVGHDR